MTKRVTDDLSMEWEAVLHEMADCQILFTKSLELIKYILEVHKYSYISPRHKDVIKQKLDELERGNHDRQDYVGDADIIENKCNRGKEKVLRCK